ncbi:MAG: hypothetical protein RJB66_2186 [Pseudomonadota bacterium]|jgi:ferrous iron transport protein A
MSFLFVRNEFGKVAVLSELAGDNAITERLIDMGLHPGVEIELIGRMPFDGPFIIRVESTFLALREEEALCLIV